MPDNAETVRNYYRRQGVKYERNRIISQVEQLICFKYVGSGQCEHDMCKALSYLKTQIESVSLFETAANSAPSQEAKDGSI